jgi:DNA-binding MarR family transcriptional regulator
MSNKQEISIRPHQEKDKVSIEKNIITGVVKLNDKTLAETNKLLSIWGMTVLQYNALRILYSEDARNKGLPSKEVGQKLYTRVPDVTRLLDRLADKGWITRERDTINRRIVRSRLTVIGIELVESIHKPIQELELQQLSALTKEEKETLSMLLKKAIDGA